MLLMLLALAVDTPVADADARLARMTALYEKICLKAFPDDAAAEGLIAAEKARELTRDEVKETMGADPARGWALPGDQGTVWLEFPPFHACTVRWNTPRIGDLKAYRAIADGYEKATGGFRRIMPLEAERHGIHIHAVGEQRPLPNKGAENLFVIDQRISDPKRRAAGETGVVLRFVHQFAPPAAPAR